jgi:hypothetical protein
MYALINAHVSELLGTIASDDISDYVWLLRELHAGDVRQDEKFQQTYCSYWALNGAGLGQAFRSAYFARLEAEKRSMDSPAVDKVAGALYDIPVAKDKKALQFSFASKLVHMVNPRLPVYDRAVEKFYFLPRSYSGTPDEKLLNLMQSYRFLLGEYGRVLNGGLLDPSIQAFRRRFKLSADYSDEKIIDTLIWKFVPFLGKGAIRDGTVVFC